MTDDAPSIEHRWEEVTSAFVHLVGCDEETRAKQLLEMRDQDPALFSEVSSLLSRDAQRCGFLDETGPLSTLLTEDAGHPDALIGRTLGDFQLEQLVAIGGMGRIYSATQSKPRRRVAVKVLANWLASDQHLQRFRYESEVLASLHHPGICHVYAAGSFDLDGQTFPYFAMEFVQGGRSVQAWSQEKQRAIAQTVELIVQVLEAVHHGHINGVIHRDLKPDNILIDSQGQPKVIDFGIARAMESGRTTHTQEGDLLGTVPYMSPEQLQPTGQPVDIRSDVYSIGVVLYEMLCGSRPRETEGRSLVQIISDADAPPTSPRSKNPSIPRPLENVILCALDNDPGKRYQTAAMFAEDLSRFLAGKPVHASPVTRWSRLVSWVSRHPVATTAVLTVLVLTMAAAIGTGVLWWYFGFRPNSLRFDSANSRLQLLSSLGYVVHEWSADTRRGIRQYVRLKGPMNSDLVAIGYGEGADESVVGQVVVYDLASPETPLWITSAVAPPPHSEVPSHPRVDQLLAVDCFPEIEGDELVVLQRLAPASPSLVRIFDTRGNLEFQFWHFGALRELKWLPSQRRLIACGRHSEFDWSQRDVVLDSSHYPNIVFAVDVERGVISEDWLASSRSTPPAILAWYKWLGPISAIGEVQFRSPEFNVPATAGEAALTGIQFYLNDAPRGGLVYLVIVLDGDGVEQRRYINDGHERLRDSGAVPHESTYRLLEFDELPAAQH